MGQLFQEQLPESTSNEDLNRLQAQHPTYDRYYLKSATTAHGRAIFEPLYERFAPYADSNFLTEIKTRFHERTWEMYVANIFLTNGYYLESSNMGPDVKLVLSDGRIVWIECGSM